MFTGGFETLDAFLEIVDVINASLNGEGVRLISNSIGK